MKSILQLVQEMHRRQDELEAKVAALEAKSRGFTSPVVVTPRKVEPSKNRVMCPKCGEQPNYFFHVKACRGPKKEQKDDRNGSPGTT